MAPSSSVHALRVVPRASLVAAGALLALPAAHARGQTDTRCENTRTAPIDARTRARTVAALRCEIVSWGRGSGRSAAGLFRVLAANPANRSRLLRRSYRDIGIGPVSGVPVKGVDGPGVTLTIIVGRR